jgi:hypothetical protein
MQNEKMNPELDQWIEQKMREAATIGKVAGFHQLQDQYAAIAQAMVRNKSREMYPDANTDPAVLRERYLELNRRKESLLNKMKVNPLPEVVAQIVGSDIAKAFFVWRGPAAVGIVLGLWGLLRHERSWDGWCVLFLSAVLATLVLQTVPAVVRFASALAASVAEFVRDMTSLRSLDGRLAQVESALAREQDLRRESQQWAADTTALLTAHYEHNKNMATRARLVA